MAESFLKRDILSVWNILKFHSIVFVLNFPFPLSFCQTKLSETNVDVIIIFFVFESEIYIHEKRLIKLRTTMRWNIRIHVAFLWYIKWSNKTKQPQKQRIFSFSVLQRITVIFSFFTQLYAWLIFHAHPPPLSGTYKKDILKNEPYHNS